ncbi:MAG: hypothetical protein RBG13Loki_2868 [Promethearchaeota archaeon CR_4]|nr:MAG: hypothetical protein RBG13Loki_2868 [Candidatus Lokiarchaeota archaeon CR_4]
MSKYQKYTTDDGTYIYPHKHCPRCNAVMDESKEYCSESCQTAVTVKHKASKKKTYMIFGILGAIIAVAIILMVIFSS